MPDFDSINQRLSDLEFIRQKELNGDLIKLISAPFATNADQIVYTPATGKTFFHFESKLYPLSSLTQPASPGAASRSVTVEITNNASVVDVLSHYNISYTGFAGGSSGGGMGTNVGTYKGNILDTLVGDAVKSYKLTSSGISGTYRVSLLGWIEDT